MNKSAVFIKRFISLCNSVVILNIGCHINNLVGYNTCFLVNFTIRSFDKAVLVNTGK